MKYLNQNWKTRTTVILFVSALISILLVGLESTDWAAQINLQGYSHGEGEAEKPNIPPVLMYILPFVKEVILICVPMFLALLIMKPGIKLKSLFNRR